MQSYTIELEAADWALLEQFTTVHNDRMRNLHQGELWHDRLDIPPGQMGRIVLRGILQEWATKRAGQPEEARCG